MKHTILVLLILLSQLTAADSFIPLRNNPGLTNQWTSLCEARLIEMSLLK